MASTPPSLRPGRLPPSVAAGVLVWLAYTVVVNAVQASSGVPYADWFKTADHAWRVAVLSLAAGSVLLIIFLRVARWDHLWRDPVRLPTPPVMRLGMWAWWLLVGVRLAGVRWAEVPPELMAALVVTGALVGFAEEMLFRGIFLRGLREGGRNEASAALWTAACFGLFHLPNVFMGTGLIGLLQIVLAGLTGAMLYVFRRHHGHIAPAMVAHGIWDISTFLGGAYGQRWLDLPSLLGQAVMVLLGIAVLVNVARHDRATTVMPVTRA